jgi:ketosteroid isomerase-like protein
VPLTVSDVIEIEQLAARYIHAADRGDGETFASTFTEDGQLGTVAGRATLAEFGAGVPERRPGVRHWLSNLLIEGDGDTATMRSYLRMTARTGPDQSPVEVATGCYEDRLLKVDGRWLFHVRTFVSD